MIVTQHGYERIQGRTKMLTKDVFTIISKGAVVELGFAEECEFLLFYSPSDAAAKIAIVSEGRGHIISIWDVDFKLPAGVTRPGRGHHSRARLALAKMITEKVEGREVNEERFQVKVQVEVGTKVIYTHDAGMALLRDAESPRSAIHFFAPLLKEMAAIVDANRKRTRTRGRIMYYICLLYPGTLVSAAYYGIRHEKVKKYLKAV